MTHPSTAGARDSRRVRWAGGPPPGPAPVQLDAAQRAVVDRVARPGHGPVLVLAGPGTGKTATIVEAVAARVASGTDPSRILVLTFSRKAATELRSRIGRRLGRPLAEPIGWTFHAFCFRLLGEAWAADPELGGRPRLLSGPEQDVTVRDLVAGGERSWPAELRPALPTRGFADELRTLLDRARSLGWDPDRLTAAARPDWAAAGAFLGEYLDVLALSRSLDYAELVAQAVAHAEAGSGALRTRFDLVVVDEYQDTDPGQVRLLQSLAGEGHDLVAVGDPDQSIYQFRGADVRGILEFPVEFPAGGPGGGPAEVHVLSVSRRAGPALLAASRAVAERLPTAGPSMVERLQQHRRLSAAPGLEPGSVEVATFPSAGAELAYLADLLRREHLDRGTPWSQMAVLVRSGTAALPGLRRVLGAAGVPVEVAGDELPVAEEPAVQPLLQAMAVAAEPARLTADVAHRLLVSALGGASPAEVRRLGRALRERERSDRIEAGASPLPSPSAELVVGALVDPQRLQGLPAEATRAARRLTGLLAAARAVHDTGGSPYEVLWALWSASAWREHLEAAAWAGGAAGRAADRDLDAVVALFEAAGRTEQRVAHRAVPAFLDELRAQQIPGDTLAERAPRAGAVRLLTAHRSKGLEWDVVVVHGVQEESWPDLRSRGSLLEPDRLGREGEVPPLPRSAVLAEERRLFYVATTRARRRLVVTAVSSGDDDGLRPSRFLDELGVPVVEIGEQPGRPLTLVALVAELRACLVDRHASAALRQAAAARLAALSEASAADDRLVPAADPERWWGVHPVTAAPSPMHPPDEPLRLSGSSLAGLEECPLRWFLGHEVRAQGPRGTSLGFGSVVHAVAADVVAGGTPADLAAMVAPLDGVWHELGFAARWQSVAERQAAEAALERLLQWHVSDRGRTALAAEQPFELSLEVGGRPVLLRGSMDRVELELRHDAEQRVVVVDLKTGRPKPTKAEVARHVQLAVYQYAVQHGALAGLVADAQPAGAELVQLRHATATGPAVQRQDPLAVDDDGRSEVDALLLRAVQRISAEEFPATPGEFCRTCPFRTVCPAQDDGRAVVP